MEVQVPAHAVGADRVLLALRDGAEVRAARSGATLTERERQVLLMLAEGRTPAWIKEELCLSIHTVHSHIRHIRQKYDARTMAHAVACAIKDGTLQEWAP